MRRPRKFTERNPFVFCTEPGIYSVEFKVFDGISEVSAINEDIIEVSEKKDSPYDGKVMIDPD